MNKLLDDLITKTFTSNYKTRESSIGVTVRLLQSVSVCCAAVRFVIVAPLFY